MQAVGTAEAERSGALGVSPGRFAERSGSLGVSPSRFAERSLRHPGFAHSCILAFALRAALDCKAGSFGPGSPLAYGFKDGLSAAFGGGLRPGAASGTGLRVPQAPRLCRGRFAARGPVPFPWQAALACEGQDGFAGVKRDGLSAAAAVGLRPGGAEGSACGQLVSEAGDGEGG